MITEHAFCAAPEGHSLWRHYAVRAKRRNDDTWIVEHMGSYLDDHGEWEAYSPADAAKFDEAMAVVLAERWAARVEVNGLTAAEALARGLR